MHCLSLRAKRSNLQSSKVRLPRSAVCDTALLAMAFDIVFLESNNVKENVETGGDRTMMRYIMLMRLSRAGKENVKEAPQRFASTQRNMKACDIKLIDMYATLGPCDYVLILEAPDEKAIFTFVTMVSADGEVNTETWRAIHFEEFSKITQELP
jgi:uncharacterized protein with GYD domain